VTTWTEPDPALFLNSMPGDRSPIMFRDRAGSGGPDSGRDSDCDGSDRGARVGDAGTATAPPLPLQHLAAHVANIADVLQRSRMVVVSPIRYGTEPVFVFGDDSRGDGDVDVNVDVDGDDGDSNPRVVSAMSTPTAAVTSAAVASATAAPAASEATHVQSRCVVDAAASGDVVWPVAVPAVTTDAALETGTTALAASDAAAAPASPALPSSPSSVPSRGGVSGGGVRGGVFADIGIDIGTAVAVDVGLVVTVEATDSTAVDFPRPSAVDTPTSTQPYKRQRHAGAPDDV
jgi:hypothetical protein